MTKYLKRTDSNGVHSYNPEGTWMFIPHDASNMDFVRMMQDVEADTATIEQVEE